jgi:hypothetical protein
VCGAVCVVLCGVPWTQVSTSVTQARIFVSTKSRGDSSAYEEERRRRREGE